MKASIIFILLPFLTGLSVAQTTWKDFAYTAPASYKVVDNTNRLVLEKFVGKQYCQFVIFPLEKTSADAAACFKAQWDFFARNAEQGVAGPETQETETQDGWTYTFGAARGNYRGQMFAITLSSRYLAGNTYFVATVVSDKQFLEDAQAFMNSVSLTKEAFAKLNLVNSAPMVNPKPDEAKGIISTTFEDGWTSTYIGPYVAVTKGNQQAWLFPVYDSLDKVGRKPNEYDEDRYWRYAVNSFFEVRNVAERPWQMSGPGTDKIFEAEVKNRRTGEVAFVAMRVIWSSGHAQTVLAFAPTKEEMYKGVFAQYNAFEQVLAYNKFVPTPQTIAGNWQSLETGATDAYSMAGGFQGGKTKVRFKDEFTFFTNGTYQSRQAIQRNASMDNDGMVRNYQGNFTLSGETLHLTGRDKEDPGFFDCWLEAVHGGLALVMVNRKFTGQRFRLLRVAQ